MSAHFETAAMSLPQLQLSRSAFVLPPAQRGYGWSEDHVQRLFQDAGCLPGPTECRFSPPPTLFLGTIYVADLADGTTAIADGQQRLVTTTMIFAVARDLSDDPAEKARLQMYLTSAPGVSRLRLRDADAAFFERWLLAPGASLRPYLHDGDELGPSDAPGPLSESQNNILLNRQLIVERLTALGSTGRARLLRFLEQDTQVVVITAPDVRAAIAAYSSTHQRGLTLSDADRLKIEIVGEAPPDERRLLANHWDEAEARLGKDALHDLFELLIFNATGRMPAGDVQSALLRHYDLPAAAAAFVVETLAPSAKAYAEILAGGATLAAHLNNSFIDKPKVRRMRAHLTTLMRVTHREWQAPALAAFTTLAGDLAMLETVIAGLDRIANLFMIVGQEPNGAEAQYAALTRAVATRNLGAIKAALAVEPGLRSKARIHLTSANFAQKQRLRTAVLLKLNDLAAGETMSIPASEMTCEHVLPQNVSKRNPTWHQAFQGAGGRYIGHNYRHRLGNLTLLTHEENRDAAARPYPEKRGVLLRSTFAVSKAIGAAHENWSPAVIDARTAALVEQLARHWDF